MYETEIAQVRQKAAEALNAWKECITKYKKTPEDKWTAQDQEKKEKARKDFEQFNNDLVKLQGKQKEEQALAHAEALYKDPVTRVPVHGPESTGPSEKQELEKKKKEEHRAAFHAYLKAPKGLGERAAMEELKSYKPEEIHALLTTTGSLGGFLVPEDFKLEVIKDLAGFAVIRPLARVMPTNRDTAVVPTIVAASSTRAAHGYTSGFTGAWKQQRTSSGGATALTTQDQPKFGQERIPIHNWEPNAIELSRETLEDSAADLDAILAEIIAEVRALDEDYEFINGTGVGRPEGLLSTSANIATVITGSKTALTFAGLENLKMTLRAQYRQNATWLMNSLTFAAAMVLETSAGADLIFKQMLLEPGKFMQHPIVFSEFMADIGEDKKPILFGDFRHYVIADRQDLRVQRLEELFAPNVGLRPYARLGGQTVRPNAFRAQICATA